MTGWLLRGTEITGIAAINAALARKCFDNAGTFALGPPRTSPVPRGWHATGILNYQSLARFTADVNAHQIPAGAHWLLYDPECWDRTPLPEQQDPLGSMHRFCDLAHTHGYKVVLTPARDLANASHPGHPELDKRPGESLDAWYLRTGIPSAAAHADAFEYQAQAHEADPAAYKSWYEKVRAAAQAARPGIGVWSGVSCARGTAEQMAAAAKTIPEAEGYWLNVMGDPAKAARFLTLMGLGGEPGQSPHPASIACGGPPESHVLGGTGRVKGSRPGM